MVKSFTISITIIILFLNAKIFCQKIKTIEVDFKREVIYKEKTELSNGQLYFQQPSKIWVKVNSPVNQIMIIDDKEMKIFYPAENIAFRIISKKSFDLPFFHYFISAADEDFGLTKMGYTFQNYERNGNKFISYWAPPKYLSKIFSKFVLEYVNKKISRIEIIGTADKSIIKTSFKNHIQYGITFFPLEIQIDYFIDPIISSEKIVFLNSRFNNNLPLDIINIKIPSNTTIKDIEW
jgi:outer membrane lipoprotein-sorting protein